MSSFEASLEQFPVIGGQLGDAMAAALQSVTTAAPFAIPAPPGGDIVSLVLFVKAMEHAGQFFPCALQGIGCGADAAAVVPTIGANYAMMDAMGEKSVAAQSI
jgi:hypothetical protein